MLMFNAARASLILSLAIVSLQISAISYATTCSLEPLGAGLDDTDQVEDAISRCGKSGLTTFAEGEYNITRSVLTSILLKVRRPVYNVFCLGK